MENGGGGDIECNKNNKEKEGSVGGEGSYRYWVREATPDAAPLPLPKKLSPQEHLPSQPNNLGSVWNTVPFFFFFFFFYHYIYIIFLIANKLVQAGTWEEKNLNNWATHRIKVNLYSILLLNSLLSLLFVTINILHFRSSYIAGAAPVGGLLGVLWWQSRNSTCVQMFW
jgi:hypothetical protein